MGKDKINLVKNIILLILWGVLTPQISYAYIDPGTGSLVLQLLLAALFGASFFCKKIILFLKKLFGLTTRTSAKNKPVAKAGTKDKEMDSIAEKNDK